MSDASIRSRISRGPPATAQTTKAPTASSATSLTTASTAMAVTMPWWRSFTSSLRVPKITVKSASPAATQSAVADRSALSLNARWRLGAGEDRE